MSRLPPIIKTWDIEENSETFIINPHSASKTVTDTDDGSFLAKQEFANKLLIDARINADTIVLDAIRDAEAKRAQIISSAEREASAIRSEAYNEAYTNGIKAAEAEISSSIAKVNSIVEYIKKGHRDKLDEDRLLYKVLAIDIAEKILCKRVEEDETDIFELIEHAVESAKMSNWVHIVVCKYSLELIDKLENTLIPILGKEGIKAIVKKEDVMPDTCIVETESGVLDASIHVQLNSLRGLFNEIKD